MHPYWDTVINPILTLRQPKTLLEIGAERGKTTRRLLSYCERQNATLHVIDPQPRFDVDVWRRRFGDRFNFHQARSLDVLPTLNPVDVAFLDGDHNWYTVFHELKYLDERCTSLGRPFPIVLLHDIGWPYGRRDLYYDPSTIPAEHRQPFAQKGIVPGSVELSQTGGVNGHLCNAIRAGGPRNGVLTGVEDFLKESSQSLHLLKIPGFHGLAVLWPFQLNDTCQKVCQFLHSWSLPQHAFQYLDRLESARLSLVFTRS